VEQAAQELLDEIDTEDCKPPKNLEERVRKMLKKSPSIRWDAAVKAIVDAEGGGAR
jgi:hypothetical protein